MSENEKKQIRKKYTYLALGLLGVIAVYIVASALIFKRVTVGYNIVIVAGLTAFWAIMDILVPLKAQDFEGKSPEQMSAYRKFAAVDLLGYAGLMYFALAMRSNTSIYGALVYVAARMMKKRFQDEFEGVEAEDDSDHMQENDASEHTREEDMHAIAAGYTETDEAGLPDQAQNEESGSAENKEEADAAPIGLSEGTTESGIHAIEAGAGKDVINGG